MRLAIGADVVPRGSEPSPREGTSRGSGWAVVEFPNQSKVQKLPVGRKSVEVCGGVVIGDPVAVGGKSAAVPVVTSSLV